MSKTHTAAFEKASTPYTARVGDREIARSDQVLIMRERNGDKDYPPVPYFPLADVDRSVLRPTDHSTFCPLKGTAAYYSVELDGTKIDNAVWYYPDPLDDVAPIDGYVAFYPDKVTVTEA